AGLQSQIRETIVSAILAGELRPGMRLPSTRRLANYLKISRITVTLAYQEPVSQGYLEAGGRSAHWVAGNPPVSAILPRGRPVPENPVDWEARMRSISTITRPVGKPLHWRRYRYPFLYGQMDLSLFDLSAWRDCARRALGREDFELMAGDFAAADDPQLVNYICSRTLPSRGIRAQADEILVTVGAQNAIWLVAQLLLGPDQHAVCENPCHPDIRATLQLSGARVSALDVDEAGLPPERLPKQFDAAFV